MHYLFVGDEAKLEKHRPLNLVFRGLHPASDSIFIRGYKFEISCPYNHAPCQRSPCMRYFVPIFIYDQKLEVIKALKVLNERFTIGLHIN